MRLTFAQIARFTSKWKALDLTDEDLQALETLIIRSPEAGALMRGTGGLRKIRFAPPSRHTGKSGATRVCHIVFADAETCYLVMVYPKNVQPNLTAEEKKAARNLIENLKAFHKRQVKDVED